VKKVCPRCGGNILPDLEDVAKCLQCGYIPGGKTISLPLVVERKNPRGSSAGWREQPSLGSVLRNDRKHGYKLPKPAGQSIRFRGKQI